jgi:hypothetical protein
VALAGDARPPGFLHAAVATLAVPTRNPVWQIWQAALDDLDFPNMRLMHGSWTNQTTRPHRPAGAAEDRRAIHLRLP